MAAGSWLGVGNDPVYVKSRCFETFPFLDEDTGLTPDLRQKITSLAEQIDAHRNEYWDFCLQPPAAPPPAAAAQAWPATLPEQVRAVAQVLSDSASSLTMAALEARFKGSGPWKKGLPLLLQTLEAVGRAQRVGEGWRGQA